MYCGKKFSFTSQTLSRTAPSLSSDTYLRQKQKSFTILLQEKRHQFEIYSCDMPYLF